MGATVNLSACLFTADKFKKRNQRGVGGNGLPLAQHALRVNNFAGEHGATVHGKLQNMHQFFAAIHFHVCAGRNIVGAALSFLRRSVIKQAPERTNGATSFDGTVVDINNAGIGGGHPLPFGMRSVWHPKNQGRSNQYQNLLQGFYKSALGVLGFKGSFYDSHAPYYKVVHRS